MKTFVGIDLGSTTTKAVLLDDNSQVIGRGITNSRSNYGTAARVASEEARIDGRFTLFRRALERRRRQERRTRRVPRRARARLPPRAVPRAARRSRGDLPRPGQGRALRQASRAASRRRSARCSSACARRRRRSTRRAPSASRTSSATSPARAITPMPRRSRATPGCPTSFCSTSTTSRSSRWRTGRRRATSATSSAARSPASSLQTARSRPGRPTCRRRSSDTLGIDLEETYLVGTGYGRVTLPFSKEHIRSEILCHGLGAHMMYPNTRTVLDIGGQDTKGIQVDRQRHRRELPDERPLRRRLRPLSRLHRRRDEHGPARTGPDGDEIGPAGAHQLDLHGVRRRRAARPALARREARGHPRRPAPRHHPARDLDHLALGRRHRRVHLHRRRRQERGGGARAAQAHQGELRRASPSTSTRSRSTPARSARPSSPAAPIEGGARPEAQA